MDYKYISHIYRHQWALLVITCLSFGGIYHFITFPKYSYTLGTSNCKGRLKYADCAIYFKHNYTSSKHCIYIQNSEAVSLNDNANVASILALDSKCHIMEHIQFTPMDDFESLLEYVKKQPKHRLIVGVCTGIKNVSIYFEKVFSTLLAGDITTESVKKGSQIINLYFVALRGFPGLSAGSINKHLPKQDAILFRRTLKLGMPFTTHHWPFSHKDIEKIHQEMHIGGFWTPPLCKPLWKIAIIVPYRERYVHLSLFLENMHRFLQAQSLEYQIFVIEQSLPEIFNKGEVLNIGYIEARKRGKFDCYIFHDVDLLPQNLHNYYGCSANPRLLTVAIDKVGYRYGYKRHFGGAVMMTEDHINLFNGYSNLLYGWGGEDDDAFNRVEAKNLTVTRYPGEIATYLMFQHRSDRKNPKNVRRVGEIAALKMTYAVDGINSAVYTLVEEQRTRLYTKIKVKIDGPTSIKDIKSYTENKTAILRKHVLHKA